MLINSKNNNGWLLCSAYYSVKKTLRTHNLYTKSMLPVELWKSLMKKECFELSLNDNEAGILNVLPVFGERRLHPLTSTQVPQKSFAAPTCFERVCFSLSFMYDQYGPFGEREFPKRK